MRRDGVRPDPRARRAADASRSRRTSTSRSSPTPDRSTTRTSRRARSTSAGRRVEAGVNPAAMARRVFDSNSFGKLKLIGALLDGDGARSTTAAWRCCTWTTRCSSARGMHQQRHRGADQPAADRARDPGGRVLQARRRTATSASACGRSTTSTSARSPARYGGGGHKNAAGFTVAGPLADVRAGDLRATRRRDRRGLGEPAADVAGTSDCRPGCRRWKLRRLEAGHCMDGVLVVDKPRARRRTTSSRARGARSATQRHRPHRHARSARDRRAVRS